MKRKQNSICAVQYAGEFILKVEFSYVVSNGPYQPRAYILCALCQFACSVLFCSALVFWASLFQLPVVPLSWSYSCSLPCFLVCNLLFLIVLCSAFVFWSLYFLCHLQLFFIKARFLTAVIILSAWTRSLREISVLMSVETKSIDYLVHKNVSVSLQLRRLQYSNKTNWVHSFRGRYANFSFAWLFPDQETVNLHLNYWTGHQVFTSYGNEA